MSNEITVKLPLERYNELLKREEVLERYQDNAIVKCTIWGAHREYFFYKKESDALLATNHMIGRLQKKIKAILNRSLMDRIFNNSWNVKGEENISL